MDRQKFIQSSTTTRVIEKRLLDKVQLDRLIEASDINEALNFLSDSVYQPYINKLERPEDYEKALASELKNSYDYMYSISPMHEVIDLMAYKYDYHNLKVMLKENLYNYNADGMYIDLGKANVNELKVKLNSGEKIMADDIFSGSIREAVDKEFTKDDSQDIDLFIDTKYFEEMMRLARELDSEFFIQYVEDLIDFTNIRTLLRYKRKGDSPEYLSKLIIDGGTISKDKYKDYLHQEIDENSNLFKSSRIYYNLKDAMAEYGNTGNLSKFEKQMDDYLMEKAKEAKKITYGPEVLFAYLVAKETEIKNLRIIFISKLNGLSSEFIRERLRDSYV